MVDIFGDFTFRWGVGGAGGGAIWANRPSNQKRKSPKKLRSIARNSGHVALRSEVSKEFLLC